VQAKDLGTGKEQKVTITASSGLNKDEVDRMMKEADAHADEDKKRRDEIETRNKADQAMYGAERLIKDMADKISASDRQAIEAAIEALKKANEGTDAAAIQSALDQLTAAQHRAAEALYKQQAPGAQGQGAQGQGAQGQGSQESQGSPGPDASAGAGGAKGDVIDAEVVDEGKQ
jgi:molecular chaperone DnaK